MVLGSSLKDAHPQHVQVGMAFQGRTDGEGVGKGAGDLGSG